MAISKDFATLSSYVAPNTTTSISGVSTSDVNRLMVARVTIFGYANAVSGVSVTGGSITWTAVSTATAISNQIYCGIFTAWAPTALSSQTITCSWTGNNVAQFTVDAYVGASNQTILVAGTDYAIAGNGAGSGTSNIINITTKAASGSWIDSVFTSWNNNIRSGYGANTSAEVSDGQQQAVSATYTPEPVTVGTYSIGANYSSSTGGWANAAMEILIASTGASGSWSDQGTPADTWTEGEVASSSWYDV